MPVQPDSSEAGWEFDWNQIKYKDAPQFLADIKSSNDDVMHVWMSKVIVAWPHDAPPNEIASYENLGWADHREAVAMLIMAYFRFVGRSITGADSGAADRPGGNSAALSEANSGE